MAKSDKTLLGLLATWEGLCRADHSSPPAATGPAASGAFGWDRPSWWPEKTDGAGKGGAPQDRANFCDSANVSLWPAYLQSQCQKLQFQWSPPKDAPASPCVVPVGPASLARRRLPCLCAECHSQPPWMAAGGMTFCSRSVLRQRWARKPCETWWACLEAQGTN